MPTLHSSYNSIKQGELSLLAIAETTAATAISVYLAIHIQTYFYMTAGVCIAPLLLLRTDRSAARALDIGSRYVFLIRQNVYFYQILNIRKTYFNLIILIFFVWIIFIVLIIGIFLIKIYSITVELIQDFFGSIRAIPTNWRYYCLQLDTTMPPELLPGIEQCMHSNLTQFRFWAFIDSIPKENLRYNLIFIPTLFLPAATLLFIPSIIYRWSIKATAIVYLPLIFTIRKNLGKRAERIDRHGDILENPLEKLNQYYAWFVIVVLNVVPCLLVLRAYSLRREITAKIDFLVSSYVSPIVGYEILRMFTWFTPDRIEICVWHVARLGGAILTIWLYSYAKRAVRKIEKGIWSEPDVEEKIRRAVFVRAVLGWVVIFYSLTILLTSLDWDQVPTILLRWHP